RASRTGGRLRPASATSSRSVGSGVPSASARDRISSRSFSASTSDAFGTKTAARPKGTGYLLPDGISRDACGRVLSVHIICQLKISDQSWRTRMAPTPVRDGRRAAIVTGGATGVGAAAAVMLAQRGYDVAIMFSKSQTEADETAALCEREGARAIAIKGNVAEDAACKAAVATTVKA